MDTRLNPCKSTAADRVGALAIRALEIDRFRGIQHLRWSPAPQLNMIVGAADGGKSTILEAISLLFTPAPAVVLSEFDYFERNVAQGFRIRAVLATNGAAPFAGEGHPPPLQGWLKGKLMDLPDEHLAEPVLVCELTGTAEFEAIYQVVGAGDEIRVPFHRALRQRIGILRLGVGDRGDRDLRLVQGGALDRFLQGQTLRHSVLQAVMKTPIHDQLGDDSKVALSSIGTQFAQKNLPNPVRLGLIGTPGVSLAASVGLTVGETDKVALPLTSWGTGTRRLAALEIASLGTSEKAIAVVDEPETGLEPYRQRVFVQGLSAEGRQSFVTTHAPAVVSAGQPAAAIWRVGASSSRGSDRIESATSPSATDHLHSHTLSPISGEELLRIARTQPEALFAKLPLVCEGPTEVGFATRLLEHRFGEHYAAWGIYCLDAGGHFRALPICLQLLKASYSVGAVVDDEGKKAGLWGHVESQAAVLRWKDGACTETAVIPCLSDTQLIQIPEWIENIRGNAARHQLAALRSTLGISDKSVSAKEAFESVGRERFIAAVLERACPRREGNAKPHGWFKTYDGGYLLADALLRVTPQPSLMVQIKLFLDEVQRRTENGA
jgi:putative ATP-dependent endonuclease of OLD family